MRVVALNIRSLTRKIFSPAICVLLLAGNIYANVQESTSGIRHLPKSNVQVLDLHHSPDFNAPAEGIRQSAPEEIQRIEQFQNRSGALRRHSVVSDTAGSILGQMRANSSHKLLILIGIARVDATRLSLRHAHVKARYPIPPPAPSV